MQSAKDIRRLTAQYSSPSAPPIVAVLKCAAGLVTLLVMAAGPWIVLTTNGPGVPEYASQPAATSPNSIAESRRVFEERRQRAQGVQETAKAALAR